MARATHIIFDFDGTIVDSLRMSLHAYNEVAPSYGFKVVGEEEIDTFRSISTKQALARLGIPLHRIPQIATQLRKEIKEEIRTVKLVDGMKECIIALSQMGYCLGIVTSNSVGNVRDCLTHNGVIDLFEFVHASFNLFGKHRVLTSLLRKHHIPPKSAVYLGDETRDVIAARKCGIPVIGVSWGLHTETLLRQANADQVALVPTDIIEYLRNGEMGR